MQTTPTMKSFSLYCRDTSPVKSISAFEVAVKLAESGGGADGTRLLCATCVLDEEIDHQIDGMIASLNRIRKAAKAKLAKSGLIEK